MNGEPHGSPPVIAGVTYVADLGSGGYSQVYLYERHMPRRQVAVKVMDADVGARRTADFESEANLMATVSSHPAILSVFEAGVSTDGRPFLVMEYCPPPQLSTRLSDGPLSVAEALAVTIQIAGAVETAHRTGIIHRDIKPANILFTAYRRPVLADFGISAMSGPESATQLRGMSVPWAPPEQLVGSGRAEPASDVYSLAATAYAMLAGHSPFELVGGANDVYELSRRIMNNPVPRIGREDVPPSLQRVLNVAMDKEPARRYGSALALARALQQVQVELNLPMTTVDVLEEVRPENARPSRPTREDDSGTRMGVFTRHDSDGSGHDAGAEAAGSAHEEGDADPAEAEETLWHGRRRTLGLVLAACVAVGLVVVPVLLVREDHAHRPQATFATAGAQAGDPLGLAAQPPRDVRGRVDGGSVVFTWDAPTEAWEGSYLYREDLPGQSPELESVRQPTVTVPVRSGRTCIEVSSVREDGKTSEPVTACVDTP